MIPERSRRVTKKHAQMVDGTVEIPSGGWALPLWKMMEFVSWDDDIPYGKIKAMFQTTNQSWYWLINVGFQPIIDFWIIHPFLSSKMDDLIIPRGIE